MGRDPAAGACHRHCGYRRIIAQLRRESFVANHKRVLRLMQ
ncbi:MULTISPECIES: IS3 family transposase [Bradyrhizobium]